MGYRVVTGEFRLSYRGVRHVGGRRDGDSIDETATDLK